MAQQKKQMKEPLELIFYTSSLSSRTVQSAMEKVLKLSPSLEKKVKIHIEVFIWDSSEANIQRFIDIFN